MNKRKTCRAKVTALGIQAAIALRKCADADRRYFAAHPIVVGRIREICPGEILMAKAVKGNEVHPNTRVWVRRGAGRELIYQFVPLQLETSQ